jgi:C4-type Zn-finger protein
MTKVEGVASHEVVVTCPSCGEDFDTIDQDQEADGEITSAMFENTIRSCSNMDILITCPSCDSEMILDRIKY